MHVLALASKTKDAGGTLLSKLKNADLKTYIGVLKEVGLAPDLKAMNKIANQVYATQLEAVIEGKGFADDDTWASIDAQVERAVVKELRQQTKAALHSHKKEQLKKIATSFIWVAVLSGSCESCEKRHGKKKTMKQWEAYGEPGSAVLKCQKECRCTLLPVDLIVAKESIKVEPAPVAKAKPAIKVTLPSEPASQPQPLNAESISAASVKLVKEGVVWTPGAREVLIADVAERLGIPIEEVKRAAWEAHKAGLIDLARADLVEAMDYKRVQASTIQGPGGATFHFVRVRPAELAKASTPAAAKATPIKAAQPATPDPVQSKPRASEHGPADVDALIAKGIAAGHDQYAAQRYADPLAGAFVLEQSEKMALEKLAQINGDLHRAGAEISIRSGVNDPVYPSGDGRHEVLERTRRYSFQGDVAANGLLRGTGSGKHEEFDRPKTEQLIKDLDRAMYELVPPAPENVTVYRGGRFTPDFIDQLEPGASITEPGYSSTSIREHAAVRFMRVESKGKAPVIQEIEVQKGSPILPLFLNSGSTDEFEILLPRGTKFEVVSKTKDKRGTWRLRLRAIPPVKPPDLPEKP
jgi:hypothetical protein